MKCQHSTSLLILVYITPLMVYITLFLMFLLYRNKERWGEHVWMGTAVVRAFSNMPLVMGDIVTIWSSNAYTDIGDLQTILDIFSDLGLVRVFDEEMLNAAIFLITAGPAFLYMLASALCEGAESFLFDPRDAQKLIAIVFHGASLMLRKGRNLPWIWCSWPRSLMKPIWLPCMCWRKKGFAAG